MDWETVIGLEVHVELSTQTKIFCGCTTEFGGAPNTHICPICTGMPGTLPVLNKKVLEYALRAALALQCEVGEITRFDRKNYFYPDLPKAYQTSQLFLPIGRNGRLQITVADKVKDIGIHEMHMEEDAGKLVHDPWEDCTLVDYNRGGVPLIEIVSEPDFRNGDEVIAYLETLRETLVYLGVTDGKMQEGSLRADINISVRPCGSLTLGTRTEMKNMNSFKAIYRAVDVEAKRQIQLISQGGQVMQETRRWDENKDASFSMRSKENAQDYRYFPDPDLPPIAIDPSWVEQVRSAMPELAGAKRLRYVEEMGITPYDAAVLTTEKKLAQLFEDAAGQCGNPKEVANLITGEVMRLMKEDGVSGDDLRLPGDSLALIADLTLKGSINRNGAKQALEALFRDGTDPQETIRSQGLMMIRDDGAIEAAAEQVIKEQADSVAEYLAGKEKVWAFLVGRCMGLLKGKADPEAVNRVLREKVNSQSTDRDK